ncbi:50S ribosomal protein L5 [Candidatus Nomurabacteria bacterium]|nr:50S ribosomal protein L5 [Candidatus Nomurabacteria bacterium]
MSKTIKEKFLESAPTLAKELGLKNMLALPSLEKIMLSTGVGKIKDQKRLDMIADRLARVTGQKAAPRGAKKSIASFKSRQGDIVGYAVTLRGDRMWSFLEKLINVAIPRIRDFRGFSETSVDEKGSLTLGLREHTIFPETADEELKDVFGFAITLNVKAKSRDQALALFRTIGFPFKKAVSK